MAWEVILVAAITSKSSRRQLTGRVGLAVISAWRNGVEQVCEAEAVVLLPESISEVELSTNRCRWNARVVSGKKT
jgi:hypothetical protein